MKRIILYIVALLTCHTYVQSAQDDSTSKNTRHEDFFIPMDLMDNTIYVEKFSPIYVQDLTEEQLQRIYGDRKTKNMSDFLELLNSYNVVLYRKFNDYIQGNIDELEYKGNFKQMYLRDFKESNDTNIRYIITNDFSIVDVFLDIKDEVRTVNATFSYYILDKKTGKKYKKSEDIRELAPMVNFYYKTEATSDITNMDAEDFQKDLLEDARKRNKTNRKRSRDTSFNGMVALFLLGNLIYALGFFLLG